MFLGIEIGGTKLQLGVGAGDGADFVTLERRDVQLSRGGAGIRDQIRSVGRELIGRYDIERVGIGFGGPVFGSRGIVQTSHQVTGWDNFPLAEWCETELGRPTRLGNDCDCAALAEASFGAGRGRKTVFYITVGTGIGGGLVIDGRVHGTDRPAAAEIGHLRLGREAGPDVEAVAAGPAIARELQQRLAEAHRADPRQLDVVDLLQRCHGDPLELTTKLIGEAAGEGNRLAAQVYRDAATHLGWAISQMITLIAPEIVVIGGGVSLAGETVFFEPLRKAVDDFAFGPLRHQVQIVPASLGESVVVHGALALARS